MTTSALDTLRKLPQPTPSQFLASQPHCWVQYYDDTPAKDPAKALSARTFAPATARRKQQEKCAVAFSLQPFAASRTQRELLCFRNMGVDVDLVPRAERSTMPGAEIDRRKEEYLQTRLLPFPLKPTWLVESRHGFHAIFRVQGQRSQAGVQDAITLNRRLVRVLEGDDNAVLLTQVLRVPGTLQFKDPVHPFLCRLLLDNAATIAPYTLSAVRGVLDAWEVFHAPQDAQPQQSAGEAPDAAPGARRRQALGGVGEGNRNAAAASVVGGILARLPEELWNTGGWGGLKEWNARNEPPLPERELRCVFESIARRERIKRAAERPGSMEGQKSPSQRVVQLEVTGVVTIREIHGESTQNSPID